MSYFSFIFGTGLRVECAEACCLKYIQKINLGQREVFFI